MKHFETLYDIAVEHNGIVTNADAMRVGVTTSEIARYRKDGRLERIGYGVYRPCHYVPTRLTRYAAALALVGEGAFIHGVSVVRMLGLIREDAGEEYAVQVATPKRIRRQLPEWLSVKRVSGFSSCVEYDGLLAQPVNEALRESTEAIDDTSLQSAIERALYKGLLTIDQCATIGMYTMSHLAQDTTSGFGVPTETWKKQTTQTPEG